MRTHNISNDGTEYKQLRDTNESNGCKYKKRNMLSQII